jgi:RNA polymerase sigma-70 factor, ECF subfamily
MNRQHRDDGLTGTTVSAVTADVDGPRTETAFETEVRPHLRSLYQGAYSLTRDAEAANDLLQDALLRGYQKFDKYQPGTNLRAWLLQVMRNVWISRRRREAGVPYVLSLDEVDEVALHRRSSRFEGRASQVEDDVIDHLGEATILRAIDTLPAVLRQVVLLADVQGASYGTIARKLDIPLGSVASRLYRGRRRLQQMLGEYAPTGRALGRAS